MITTTQVRYQSRIQSVIDHIYNHPAGPVDNDTLGEVANLSSFHWHRIYRSITGETAAQTVRRTRMHRAACELVRTCQPVSTIGQTVGYPSVQSFVRAFKSYYEQSPGEFRNAHKEPQTKVNSNTTNDKEEYEVVVAEEPAMRLAGVWHTGDYAMIGQSFEQVMAILSMLDAPMSEMVCVGVYFADPFSVSDLSTLKSFAGVLVSDSVELPEALTEYHVPAGSCAALTYQGPYALLEQPYLWLFGKWLLESELLINDRPGYEVYLNNPRDTKPDRLLTKICLPLVG